MGPCHHGAELLFPGAEVDGAPVEVGELAIAFWTGSNGIALSGPPHDLADRLEQAAASVRAARLLTEPPRHLPDGLDPWVWSALGTGPDGEEDSGTTVCRTTGVTVRDPRRVTCGDCVTTWNNRWPGQFTFPAALPVPAAPADCRIGEHLPYASITWHGDDTEEATAARAADGN
ncbi:hypothetical protein [Streptomyces collinus]|uniref:hypothetical protein n=1 Tax=Streptomyces collinus TaxID=42684 RepID=UPI0034017090